LRRFDTDPQTSERMRRVRQRDTAPELALRKWLWGEGVRYTTHNNDLPGSPDLANRTKGWAIFVHGCFWHGHEGCPRSRLPKRNTEAWREKILGNKARDRSKEEQLTALGLEVFIVWECKLEDCLKRGMPPMDPLRLLRHQRSRPLRPSTRQPQPRRPPT
jgi:DNA mismatch endonuclease, patch repair protein